MPKTPTASPRILLVSHAFFWLATSLTAPIFSVFSINELKGVTVTEVGIANLLFYLSFGLLEPLIGVLSDSIRGLKDDVVLLVIGYISRGLLFILFSFAQNHVHLYLFYLILGITRAMVSPSDKVLYSHFINKKRQATLWGLDDSLINLSAAVGAGISGYFILGYGFRNMLIITGIITIAAGILNTFLFRQIKAELLPIHLPSRLKRTKSIHRLIK